MILSQDRLNLIYDEKKGIQRTMGILMNCLFSQLLDGRDAFWKLIENEKRTDGADDADAVHGPSFAEKYQRRSAVWAGKYI